MAASPRCPGRRAWPRALSVAAVLACLLAAGCAGQGAGHDARRPAGIISGTLILEYPAGGGGFPGGAVLNLPGRGRLEVVSGGTVVARVVTGSSGGFRVRVPAGRYRFVLVAPVRAACASDTPPAPRAFIVRPGRVNQVQAVCPARLHHHRK